MNIIKYFKYQNKNNNNISKTISNKFLSSFSTQINHHHNCKIPSNKFKNILITSSLPYVNNSPHLGNIIGGLLSADVYARFCRLMGFNVLFISGTDQYGTTTQIKALKDKKSPQQICNIGYNKNKQIYKWFDISYNHFGRTSTSHHKFITDKIFKDLIDNNLIIEKQIVQFFCQKCQLTLADRYINGQCLYCQYKQARADQCQKCSKIFENPIQQLINPKCQICKTTPIAKLSKHLYFKYSQTNEKLRKWLEEESGFQTWSNNSKGMTKSWIDSKLKDRCITRDLNWGIPVPYQNYQSKVFYVWFEAPFGYISITKDLLKQQYQKWWIKDPKYKVQLVQFMGKDNLIFHSLLSPATLLSCNQNWVTPTKLSVTEYLLYEGGKFSKSRGIGIFGQNCLQIQLPCEVWRYYLLINRPQKYDSQFIWQDFKIRNNKQLLASIGNFINRVLKLSYRLYQNQIPELKQQDLQRIDINLLNNIKNQWIIYINYLMQIEIKCAVNQILKMSYIFNKYLQDNQFWNNNSRQNIILAFILRFIQFYSYVIEPIIPSTSQKINYMLGTSNDKSQQQQVYIFKEINQNFNNFIFNCLNHSSGLKQPFHLFRQRNQIQLFKNQHLKEFENSLFYVEIDGNNKDLKSNIQFQQKILLRHKISNKYLSYSFQFQQEQNDTIYKLKLSQNKKFFKILPCFRYQTIISSRVKFNQEIYLSTQVSQAKISYVSTRKCQNPQLLKVWVGSNSKSKFILHSYALCQKQQICYTFGSIIWLLHVERSMLLKVSQINNNNKDQIIFGSMQLDKDLQSISGLWLIQSQEIKIGGKVQFEQKFRLKNLLSGSYLSFSKNYKFIGNQRIYSIILQENVLDQSKFIFKSLNGQENKIKKGSYLKFLHSQSKLHITCREQNKIKQTDQIKPTSQAQFQDQDLYKIIVLNQNQQQALRFICSVRIQLKLIQMNFTKNIITSQLYLLQCQQVYSNIKQELTKLSKYDKLFEKVQFQMNSYIVLLTKQMVEWRKLYQNNKSIKKIIHLLYSILQQICKGHHYNQKNTHNFIADYANDIFMGLGAQALLIQIFRNNYSLLCIVPKSIPQMDNENILHRTIDIIRHKTGKKGQQTWSKILQIINFFITLIYLNGNTIDINQRLMSVELFDKNIFDEIFFRIKIIDKRIKVFYPPQNKMIEIELIRNSQFIIILEKLFILLSYLCSNRNFIAKKYIDKYLNQNQRNGPQILIMYLSIPVSKNLSSTFYLLVTNLYIDSCPRIIRHKPLAVVNFIMQPQQRYSHDQQAEISSRLKDTLLQKVQKSYASRPLQISNILQYSTVIQPSVSNEQLQLYKQELNDKMRNNLWSPDLLRSIRILIKLQSYSCNEIIEIFEKISLTIQQDELTSEIIIKIMQLLNEIVLFMQQLELNKTTIYLKYKYRLENGFDFNDIKYFLPCGPRIYFLQFITNPNQFRNYKQIQKNIQQYNNARQQLSHLYPTSKLKQTILKLFIKDSKTTLPHLNSLFDLILKFNKFQNNFLIMLMNSIVITSDQIDNFQKLFQLYKKVKHLISISQYWLCNNEEKQNTNIFMQSMTEFINFFYDGYQFNSIVNNKNIININRQLLIRNLGISSSIFELLQTNFHLLQPHNTKQVLKKHIHTFEICFQFLYNFCYGCDENKIIVYRHWHILQKFLNFIQVGQTKLFNQLYHDNKDYIRQISPLFIEKVIYNIIQNPKIHSNQNCAYNPIYLQFFQTIIMQKGKPYRSNIEIMYRFLEKDYTLPKILFVQQKTGLLSLDINLIKNDPIQIPYLYHAKILHIIYIIIKQLDTQSMSLRNRLQDMLSFDYIFSRLSQPDIYTNIGIQAQLNFLVKPSLMRILMCFLDKNNVLTKLYDSDNLKQLLEFYQKCYIMRIKKINLSAENQKLFQYYLKQLKPELQFYKNNERQYYIKFIKPFLKKISNIFSKVNNKQQNQIFLYSQSLLHKIHSQQLCQNYQMKNIQHGHNIDKLSLKWRNFADHDQNNSKEEKFAKKTILDILQSSQTQKIIKQQRQQFYNLIKSKQTQFTQNTLQLLKIAMQEEITESDIDKNIQQISLILEVLVDYLNSTDNNCQGSITTTLINCKLPQILIHYSTKSSFRFQKLLYRKLFYQILSILNFMIKKDKDYKVRKIIYKFFQENMLSFRFFKILKQSILTISDKLDNQNFLDQVNSAISQMYLCIQTPKFNINKQALDFITKLCDYMPFTSFLRFQSLYPSIDFLQIIYNSMNYILYQQTNNIIITVTTVDPVQSILTCITSMMTGCNQNNQNYVIDNKFPQIINQILMIQQIKSTQKQADIAERNRLIQEVLQFYLSNGIDISKNLHTKINLFDFNHPYLLNRFKSQMLHTLLQTLAGNERSLAKTCVQIPIELFKINMIWVYEDFLEGNFKYSQSLILRQKQPWQDVIEKTNLDGMFIIIGLFLYILIEMNSHKNKDSPQDEQDNSGDKEKNKQKIVQKFFGSISEKKKHQEKIKNLQKQHFYEQMKQFYQKYYQSLEFFSKKTLNIEVNIFGNLSLIYFPKVPICDEITQQMIQKFKNSANRFSQDQKIKSLLEFEKDTYQYAQGQQDFFIQMSNKFPKFQYFIRMLKYQNNILLIGWGLSVIQTLLFLLQNFQNPSFQFVDGISLTPSTTIQIFSFLITLLSILLSFGLGISLFTFKIPFYISLMSQKYQNQKVKRSSQIFDSKIYFVSTSVIKQVAYQFLMMLFMASTIIHPIFAGFVLMQIINRMHLGRQIIRSIRQTWFQLITAAALLFMFNYMYALYIYIVWTSFYGPTCQSLYQCMLFLVDQSLKSDSGFLGSVPIDYVKSVMNIKFFSQIIYVVFAQKVVFEIFSGTIIDKFSELRQQSEETIKDQAQFCYICGQQRFTIDFELQGFEDHTKINHNSMNYVFYLFYIRRKHPAQYGIVEKYVKQSRIRKKNDWIPDQTSLFKIEKEKNEQKQEEEQNQNKHKNYYLKKINQFKALKKKSQSIISQIKNQDQQ